jgi:parallel beta-helix repeat protein
MPFDHTEIGKTMRLHTTKLLILLAIVSVFLITGQTLIISNSSQIKLERSYSPSYAAHSVIWIQNNQEFQNQATAESWAGNGTESNPYIISGYSFDQDTQPVRIWNTDVYWIFKNNLVTGTVGSAQCGIWLESCSNGAIIHNEICNRHSGMYTSSIENTVIFENIIHDCRGNGLEIGGGMSNTIINENTIRNIGMNGIYSNPTINCTIQGNTLSDIDEIGIDLLGGSAGCNVTDNSIDNCGSSGIKISVASGCFVTHNNISSTTTNGLHMVGALECNVTENRINNIIGDGMELYSARYSTVSENFIINCTGSGLLLTSGVESGFYWNYIKNTSEYAMNIGPSCANFSVMYNSFFGCGSDSQLCDDGTTNIISYNFYSDWTSPDADGNGFVDVPYILDGNAENQDAFPLAIEGVVPTSSNSNGGDILPIEMWLGGGAIAAIVLLSLILFLKRR